jgi:hypothetical protein
MNLNWILTNPATPYGALALALVVCLVFIFNVEREIHGLKAAARKDGESVRGDLDGLAKALQGVKEGIREIEVAPAALPPGETISLTKHAQALRMHRRGEPIPTIAAALRTPQNEIRLLIKVHETLNSAN